MEIDQQADRDSAQAHVGQELRLVHGMDRFDGLYLDNDRVLDDQIHAISEFYFFAVVDDRQPNLRRYTHPTLSQLVRQAGLVSAFHQSRERSGLSSRNLPRHP